MDPQGLLHRGDAALAHAHPHAAGVGGEPVDVVEGEAGVGDRLQARVDRQRQGVDHEATPEAGPADAGEHGAVLEAVVAERSRSEEHTSELQSLMRISYAVFCLKTKKHNTS